MEQYRCFGLSVPSAGEAGKMTYRFGPRLDIAIEQTPEPFEHFFLL
jgi:hypothetical protein